MFDYLKNGIREEIGNKTVLDISDATAEKLRQMAKTAKEQRNFEKNIACREMILEDLKKHYNSDKLFDVKIDLLKEYSDCGYYSTNEAVDLTVELIKQFNEKSSTHVLPKLHVTAIKPLYCSNDETMKQIARVYADTTFEVCLDLFIQNQNSNEKYFIMKFQESHRELSRICINEKRYGDFYKSIKKLTDRKVYAIDHVVKSLWAILDIYNSSSNDSHCMECINELKGMALTPEAYYILGILYAEGYKVEKNVSLAKDYFEKARMCANKVKGQEGYTDYEFKILSPIPSSEIIKQAQQGEYHSVFYSQRNSIYSGGKILYGTQSSAQNGVKKSSPQQNKNINGTQQNKTSKGCYVATCVYGSYDCPPVWTLRRFRDEILSNSFLGRAFIKMYYAISPTAVRLFGKQKWFHKLFKSPLDKLVKKLQDNGVESTPYND